MEQTPFIIDPEEMSLSWIQNFASNKCTQVDLIQANDQRLSSKIELGVKFGKSLVLLNCDAIDPFIYPLLRKEVYCSGSRNMIMLGSKKVDYNTNFRLFLCSKIEKIKLPPHSRGIVTLINFTVTKKGLERILLSTIVEYKRPELENKLKVLVIEEDKHNSETQRLEFNLLQMLSNSEGDILENQSLIDTLVSTTESAVKVSKAFEKNIKTRVTLEDQRLIYSDIASFGSTIYALLERLHVVSSNKKFDENLYHLKYKAVSLRFVLNWPDESFLQI